eukprot:76339-Pleurochrysis_carterae.AAC.5
MHACNCSSGAERLGPPRHYDQRRACAAARVHRPPRRGALDRQGHDAQAARAHPAAAVQGAHPGGHRTEDRRLLRHLAHAQGRACQVLRRRHHAQEEAALEAGQGQEAHEGHRKGQRAAGGVHGSAQPQGRQLSMFAGIRRPRFATKRKGRWRIRQRKQKTVS